MANSISSVSFYFYAGDFRSAIENYRHNKEQTYATHGEIAQLVHQLSAAGVAVRLCSFDTPEKTSVKLSSLIEIVSLGGRSHNDWMLIRDAVRSDPSDAIIPHFPHPTLLSATIARKVPAAVVLADSYNRTGLKARVRKFLAAWQLNNPAFEFVANHCEPSTVALAEMGVHKDKLVAWDVPHRFLPHSVSSKTAWSEGDLTIAYAGSVTEEKGVFDLVRAVALLAKGGQTARLKIAGSGDLIKLRALAGELNVANLVDALGVIGNAEVFDLFRVSDVVVVPSRTSFPEGFPLTMFEAIASRTPIVCSDHPMFRPIMVDRVNAMTYTSGDAIQLASAITALFAEPKLYEKLSDAAEGSWAKLSNTCDWQTLLLDWILKGKKPTWSARPIV